VQNKKGGQTSVACAPIRRAQRVHVLLWPAASYEQREFNQNYASHMLSQQLAAAASAAAVFGEHRDHPMRGQHTNDVDHNDPLFAKRRGAARSSGHRIRGIATPPARRDMLSEETPFVTVEDVDDVCQRCLGLPVMSEHTVGEVLGRVVSARRDARNRIVVDVDIEDTVEGWRTLTSVRDGKRLGFSLGQRFGGTRNDKGELTSADHKLPVELSVTESPEFAEDAWITYVTPTSNEHKQLVRELTEPNEQLGEKSHPDERAVLEFVGTPIEGGVRTHLKHISLHIDFFLSPPQLLQAHLT